MKQLFFFCFLDLRTQIWCYFKDLMSRSTCKACLKVSISKILFFQCVTSSQGDKNPIYLNYGITLLIFQLFCIKKWYRLLKLNHYYLKDGLQKNYIFVNVTYKNTTCFNIQNYIFVNIIVRELIFCIDAQLIKIRYCGIG